MSASGRPNAQALKLLRTLGMFIVTLAKSVNAKDEKERDDLMLGVEAIEFMTELEKFLSSSQHRKEERSIEVTLNTAGQDSSPPLVREMDYVLPIHISAAPQILGMQLADLRKQITTCMPIRVLHFEPLGSKLNISLIDQNTIYAHLSKKFQVNVNPGLGYMNGPSHWISDHTRYAVLSHTWNEIPGELTYTDWNSGQLDSQDPKCQKLINFCRVAYKMHRLPFAWIDTVCINKDSSSELDESIRSMYKWYRNATVCVTYLGTTTSLSDMAGDPWFTRGWTFQELVAPQFIKFYNKDWQQLIPLEDNDKQNASILKSIKTRTTMTQAELENMGAVSISRRMELAMQRKVTREEDAAYSLMGIFNVSIATAYGEGAERACFRLLKEILDTNKDVSDIFNWSSDMDMVQGYSPITSLFPRNLYSYTNRSRHPELRPWRPIEPLTLTHLGLRTPVLLMAAELLSRQDTPNCPLGDYIATVSVKSPDEREYYIHHLFQNRDFTTALGVLNVEDHNDGSSIRIRKTCFAVLLKQEQDGLNSLGMYEKQDTEQPIIFTFKKVGNAIDNSSDYYVVRKDNLERHGMKLVTLYL